MVRNTVHIQGPLHAIETIAEAETDEDNRACGIFGLLPVKISALNRHLSSFNVPRNHQNPLALFLHLFRVL